MALDSSPIDIFRGTSDKKGKIIITGSIYIACNMGSLRSVGLEKSVSSTFVVSNFLSYFYLYL